MEKFKQYMDATASWYVETVTQYPVKAPTVALVIGFALGYWVG